MFLHFSYLFIGSESLPDKATMRSDAAAELDRFITSKRPSGPSSGPNSANSSGVDFNASDC